jgi:hypothetical protein
MRLFTFIRLFSLFELALFSALLVVWIGGIDDGAKTTLGWAHGFGWIALCICIAYACTRRVLPWPVLGAAVSPLGPIGSTIGIEWVARRGPRPAVR